MSRPLSADAWCRGLGAEPGQCPPAQVLGHTGTCPRGLPAPSPARTGEQALGEQQLLRQGGRALGRGDAARGPRTAGRTGTPRFATRPVTPVLWGTETPVPARRCERGAPGKGPVWRGAQGGSKRIGGPAKGDPRQDCWTCVTQLPRPVGASLLTEKASLTPPRWGAGCAADGLGLPAQAPALAMAGDRQAGPSEQRCGPVGQGPSSS